MYVASINYVRVSLKTTSTLANSLYQDRLHKNNFKYQRFMGFSKRRASLLLDGLQIYVLTMCDKQSCDDKEDWICCHHCADMNTMHVVVLIEMLKPIEAD